MQTAIRATWVNLAFFKSSKVYDAALCIFNITYHFSSTEGLSVAKCALTFTTHIESLTTSLSLLYITTI